MHSVKLNDGEVVPLRWQDAAECPDSTFALMRLRLRSPMLAAASHIQDLHRWVQPASPTLRLLYCHYVFDGQVKDFERLLSSLQQLGRFITSDECLAILDGSRELDGNAFHLSFDDGFENIATNAAPVLGRLGIPALFFVPTALVGVGGAELEHYCLEVTRYRAVIPTASWDQLGKLVEQGIDIGSHTRTHARFAELSSSPARLEDEIAGSKHDIERELGKPCQYISWPFGQVHDADAASLQAVKRAGYRACFSAARGHVVPRMTDAFAIPRHHFEPHWPWSHVRYFARGGREPT